MEVVLRREWLVRWALLLLLLVALTLYVVSGRPAEDDVEVGAAVDREEAPGLSSQDVIAISKKPDEPSVDFGTNEDFFIEFRLERRRNRSRQLEWLSRVAKDEKADRSVREEASRRLVEQTKKMELEMEMEGLIKAKGFEDALVFLFDEAATVVVKSADPLTGPEVARIADVVSRGTGLGMDRITVVGRGP